MSLGLTYLQAQVYVTLVKFGKAEAKTISSATNVARGDVYRVMATLEKLGLAEKLIYTPTTFQATPLKEGYELLLQNKEQEYVTLTEEVIEAMNGIPEKAEMSMPDDQKIIMISSEKLFQDEIQTECNNSTKSINIAISWKSLSVKEFDQLPIHEKALERGVKIKLLTEKHDGVAFEKLYPSLLKNKRIFEIRYINPPIPLRGSIIDDAHIIISTKQSKDPQVTPVLCSNNLQLVRAITAYFDQIWQTAEQIQSNSN
jgi:Predicted transcriptional regulators